MDIEKFTREILLLLNSYGIIIPEIGEIKAMEPKHLKTMEKNTVLT
jgi:hypothetical protein